MRLWNLQDKIQDSVLQACYHEVLCIAITYDDKFIIYGGKNEFLRVCYLPSKSYHFLMYKGITRSIATTSFINKYVISSGDKQL